MNNTGSDHSFVLECSVIQRKNQTDNISDLALKNTILELQKKSGELKISIYDHLADLVKFVLDRKPRDGADFIAEYSSILLRKAYSEQQQRFLQPVYIGPCLNASRLILNVLCSDSSPNLSSLGKVPTWTENASISTEQVENSESYDEADDFMLLNHYWALLGIGFTCSYSFLLSCSLNKLKERHNLRDIRFWGKIFGTGKNYYIAEAKFPSKEMQERLQSLREQTKEKTDNINEIMPVNVNLVPYLATEALIFLNVAPPDYPALPQKIVQTVKDEYDNVLNSKVYFVCNDFIQDWIELPAVTNQQIEMSRTILKYFTGDLGAVVSQFPYFNGLEKNYLRAVIARISASTHVSPRGTYITRLQQEKIGQGDTGLEVVSNANYKKLEIDELIDIKNWVHHSPSIYDHGGVTPHASSDIDDNVVETEPPIVDENQGKTTAAPPKGKDPPPAKKGVSDATAEKSMPINAVADNQSEIPEGICLFRPCSEDHSKSDLESWTLSHTKAINCLRNLVLLQSNIWCGAFTFTAGSITESIYKGWGIKNQARIYLPIIDFQNEANEEDLVELTDPTPVEEEMWWQENQQTDTEAA